MLADDKVSGSFGHCRSTPCGGPQAPDGALVSAGRSPGRLPLPTGA